MRSAVLTLLILAAPAFAQPETPAPATPWIVAPNVTPSPSPKPPAPPAPDSAILLPAGVYYVLDVREPCFVLASPPGVISVAQGAGPATYFARFFGGSGEEEER